MIYRVNRSILDNPWRRMDPQQVYDAYNAAYNAGNFPNYGGQPNPYGYDRYGGLGHPGYMVPGRQVYDGVSNMALYPSMNGYLGRQSGLEEEFLDRARMQAERERLLGTFRNRDFNNEYYPPRGPYVPREVPYQQRERGDDPYDGQHIHPSHSRHRGMPRMAEDFPTVRAREQTHTLSRGSEERLRGEFLASQSGREERLREAFLGGHSGEKRLREEFLASQGTEEKNREEFLASRDSESKPHNLQ